jgi:molecular chaperone DnaK
VPQIEVTFDIDANGIVSVTAVDKGTNKTANVTITATTNLTDADIDKAIKEAEMYAEEDRKFREMVDLKNTGEQLILGVEKFLSENADKVSAEDKEALENAAKEAKEKLAKADDAEAVKAATEELAKITNPIFTKLYQQGESDAGADSDSANESTIDINPEDIN